MAYKVGQLVKNSRNKLVRRITKIGKTHIRWQSKDGKKEGECLPETMKKFGEGKDA